MLGLKLWSPCLFTKQPYLQSSLSTTWFQTPQMSQIKAEEESSDWAPITWNSQSKTVPKFETFWHCVNTSKYSRFQSTLNFGYWIRDAPLGNLCKHSQIQKPLAPHTSETGSQPTPLKWVKTYHTHGGRGIQAVTKSNILQHWSLNTLPGQSELFTPHTWGGLKILLRSTNNKSWKWSCGLHPFCDICTPGHTYYECMHVQVHTCTQTFINN